MERKRLIVQHPILSVDSLILWYNWSLLTALIIKKYSNNIFADFCFLKRRNGFIVSWNRGVVARGFF